MRFTSQLLESRAMPMTTPSSVASTMPVTATRRVLYKPTAMTLKKLSLEASYGTPKAVPSAMENPAVCDKKSKVKFRFCFFNPTLTLLMTKAIAAITSTRKTICASTASFFTSR
jgi:hypothetical protein